MSKSYWFLFIGCCPFNLLAQNQLRSPHSWSNLIAHDLVTVEANHGKTDSKPSEPDVRRYSGNVRLRHHGTLLFCDRATHQLTTNSISAVGHVLFVQNDSLTVKSDSLFYDVPGQQAVLTGHVQLQNGRSVLTATQLRYDLRMGTACYKGKGRLANGRSVQTIADGVYDVRTHYLAVNSASSSQPLSNVPDREPTANASLARSAAQVQEENRPVHLTMSPKPNNIVTKPESVSIYKRQDRVPQRPIQTAASDREQVADESDLEHLLNRKKRVF